jgi:hypothetical protein
MKTSSKVAILIAAAIIPGGFITLLAAALVKYLTKSSAK